MDEHISVSPWPRRRTLALWVLAVLVLSVLVWRCWPRGLRVAAADVHTVRVERGVFDAGDPASILLLPDGAYLADSGGAWVFVLLGGEATRRSVTLGRRRHGQIEVIDGLAQGENVIVSSYADFGGAMRLQIVK